jgi:folate-binding protein YgfZ
MLVERACRRGVAVAVPWGSRRVLILPMDAPFTVGEGTRDSWERADIAAGLPQVYAATSEAFVAQMLNLDLLGAIAFDKGCYTGQEVIARAHYRGRVKRRMQRWHNLSGTHLEPGQTAQAGDGRTVVVVRTVNDGPGARNCWRWGITWRLPAATMWVPRTRGRQCARATRERTAHASLHPARLRRAQRRANDTSTCAYSAARAGVRIG